MSEHFVGVWYGTLGSSRVYVASCLDRRKLIPTPGGDTPTDYLEHRPL